MTGRIRIALLTVGLLGVCAASYWLIHRSSEMRSIQGVELMSSGNLPPSSSQSKQSNFDTNRAEMKSREERERDLINSFPPSERADTKWMLQQWGKTDLANRGKGGAR